MSGRMRMIAGIIVTVLGVYALSFALDVLFGGWTGIYQRGYGAAVATWSIAAWVLLFVGYSLLIRSRWFAVPFLALGALAFVGGVVGHTINFGVAAVLLALGAIAWRATDARR